MKLRRVGTEQAGHNGVIAASLNPHVNRRRFLGAAGLGLGLAAIGPSLVRETAAADAPAGAPKLEQHKTICGNCSVGCGFIGEVQNGVWVSMEPWYEHPINRGSLCSKGSAAREHVISEKRLRYPMKLEGGKWKRLSWEQAMSEVVAKMQGIRKEYGPDSLMILGSAHHTNEAGFALRKFSVLWGSHNIDHQARICHSTTVAGLANVWGYGAMTNSMNDIRNSKSILVIGENLCESHPISMQHVLHAIEVNKAKMIVAEPRFTKTAAFAHQFVRTRSGTDVAFIYGLVNIILANGWEDKKMINDRTYGFEALKKELVRYDTKTVADICGVTEAQLQTTAKTLAQNRPGCVIWAMGGTQHSNGTGVVRSYCILQLVLGNMGRPGGGCNVFRGHDNVQGATDIGVTCDSLPGYYGLAPTAYKHWGGVWDLTPEYMASRYKDEKMMGKAGFTVARWYEGVLMDKKDLGQDTNIHGVIYWGHASNCLSQLDRVKTALEKVDFIVDIDPFVTVTSTLPERKDGIYLLPAATVYEQAGSVTNSNRGIQWRNQIVKPVWEARTDLDIMIDFANRLGFGKEFTKNKTGPWKHLPEDVTREWNLGMLSVGMRGQTPERMKRQQDWGQVFNLDDCRATSGPVKGEQWGLPWPCWNDKHPGTAILYRTDLPVQQGGSAFRARWGDKAPDGVSMLAGKGSAPKGSPVKEGYVETAGWATDLTGKTINDAVAKGMIPFGNGRARIDAWGIPDSVPKHREPIHTPRADLITAWVTYDDKPDFYRVPTLYRSLQKPEWAKNYPVILTTGRQVEFEGGGAAERACSWLVELQPEMYIEIHPEMAAKHGIKHGDWVLIESPEDTDGKPSKAKVKAKITHRVGADTVFMPFHWGGTFEGKSYTDRMPADNIPFGIGESANVVTNYGYDILTQMQETKTGLCRISKA